MEGNGFGGKAQKGKILWRHLLISPTKWNIPNITRVEPKRCTQSLNARLFDIETARNEQTDGGLIVLGERRLI